MESTTDRKKMLLAMKTEIMEQFESMKARLDAVDLLLAHEEEGIPDAPVSTVETIRMGCVEILAESGMEVHRNILLEMLEERGIHVGGKVPVNSLGSILSRFSKDFISHGQGMWSWNNKPIYTNNPPDNVNGHVVSPRDPASSLLNED